jgi:DNA-directed RNA polymerase specialized sigma24 family protein
MNPMFPTTRWTLVARATSADFSTRQAALAELLSQSWYPLYAFLRRSGQADHEIEDLIQGFYLRILESDLLTNVEQHRQGRFRNFLVTCLKNYVANEWQRDRAIKRGGQAKKLSLDLKLANERYQFEPSHAMTPQRAFERAWAIDMLDRSLKEVARRWHETGKGRKFDLLKVYLTRSDDVPRADVAAELGMTPAALKVAVHRLRAEFRSTLCQQVAETLERDDLLEDEINQLFSALSV